MTPFTRETACNKTSSRGSARPSFYVHKEERTSRTENDRPHDDDDDDDVQWFNVRLKAD